MKHAHEMPFGAQTTPGGVRFALWAPSAGAVDVHVERLGALPMEPRPDGWFELLAAGARAGDRYAFAIDGKTSPLVPDPASRYQPDDVHAMSEVVDPLAFEWTDDDWAGLPWEEHVFYELHVGTFTPEGTFGAAAAKLDALADLGITAVELMPLSEAPGAHNWGYDGVFPYAPEHRYGTPADLKRFVCEAHRRGLAVFVDVVYNHFGPEGNYLHAYAPQFFTERYHTPWGAALDYEDRRPVREFAIHNALYWIDEYHVDGLRLDAVHTIYDGTRPAILDELAARVRAAFPARRVHLVLENDDNQAALLTPYDAQWDDDVHHALHVAITGEDGGYYRDYADPVGKLARTLAEGFAYQGDPSINRDGAPRGTPSGDLPPTKFVPFLQNHDQIGNRAFGERISALAPPEAVRAAAAVNLLTPMIPLLFMGEEWAASTPFQFFCDFSGDLAGAVREGRRREFAAFAQFSSEEARARIPDPSDPATFARCVLRWDERERAPHREMLAFYQEALAARRRDIVPHLAGTAAHRAHVDRLGERGVRARWTLGDGAVLELTANLGPDPSPAPPDPLEGRTVFETGGAASGGPLAPWSVRAVLRENGAA